MTVSREFEAIRLDVQRFADDGALLQGEWPLRELPRLLDSAAEDRRPGPDSTVHWQARGQRVAGPDPAIWLHVGARTSIALQCQRCLAPVDVEVEVDRRFRFVRGEAAAAALDATSEDDVLALTRALNLRELIEDELLLALPLVPMHAVCPTPLQVEKEGLEVAEEANPFAVLAALKRERGADH